MCQEALISVGYITDEVTPTLVFLAAQLQRLVLLEGPRGSGKAELAYAVAKATGAEVGRLQCYEGINEEKAIGKFDELLQRLRVELLSKSVNLDCQTAKQELHGLQFFSAGPCSGRAARKALRVAYRFRPVGRTEEPEHQIPSCWLIVQAPEQPCHLH